MPLAALWALVARTEVLAEAPTAIECSTAVRVQPGATRSVQTWDWHAPLAPRMLLIDDRTSAVPYVTVTEPGIPAKICTNAAGIAVVPPRPDGVLVDTNHFLDPGLARGEASHEPGSTRPRLAHLERQRATIAAANTDDELARAACGTAGEAAPICVQESLALPAADRWRTLMTAWLDPATQSMHTASGTPASHGTRVSSRVEREQRTN